MNSFQIGITLCKYIIILPAQRLNPRNNCIPNPIQIELPVNLKTLASEAYSGVISMIIEIDQI